MYYVMRMLLIVIFVLNSLLLATNKAPQIKIVKSMDKPPPQITMRETTNILGPKGKVEDCIDTCCIYCLFGCFKTYEFTNQVYNDQIKPKLQDALMHLKTN